MMRSALALSLCVLAILSCDRNKKERNAAPLVITEPIQTAMAAIEIQGGTEAPAVWASSDPDVKFDVEVEYRSNGRCKAYLVPAMTGGQGGVATADSVPDGPPVHQLFRQASSIKLGCRPCDYGECFLVVHRAIRSGTVPTQNLARPNPEYPKCNDGTSPVILKSDTSCDVIVRATIPNGCAGKIYEEGKFASAIEVSGTKLVSFSGVKTLLARCDGSGNRNCSFEARGLCAEP